MKGVTTCTKRAPHVSHLYGFSPEWMRVWVLRLAGLLNWAPQILQRYGFSPEKKKSLQNSATNTPERQHMNCSIFIRFFLPVWTVLWLARMPLYRNAAWQRSHLYGLSLCTWSICCFRASSSANLESHSLQKNVPFSVQEKAKVKVNCCSCVALNQPWCEKKSHTHHSWSLNIQNEALPCLLIGGTWRFWDRPLSAVGTGSRRLSSWGGSGSVEGGHRHSSVTPQVHCRLTNCSI